MGDSYWLRSVNCPRRLAEIESWKNSTRRPLVTLGIEGSANKIGVGICDVNGVVYANPRDTYMTPPGTGFQPRETERHHRQRVVQILDDALKEAGISDLQSGIDLIAYTRGPGLGSCLSVGATVARTLAMSLKKPIIGVNHCVAHIEMGRVVTGAKNPVVLYASGGNTQIIAYEGQKYAIWGETLDIAAGNCIDRVARILGLSNDPAPGWQIEQKAKEWKSGELLDLPYKVKGMDLSFSGIATKIETLWKDREHPAKRRQGTAPQEITVEAICYALQETMFGMLIEVTERVMAATKADAVLLVGGVGCNLRLQEMMQSMAVDRGAVMGAMDEKYCIDNGAMIAYSGALTYLSGFETPIESSDWTQRYRTDTVPITWREH